MAMSPHTALLAKRSQRSLKSRLQLLPRRETSHNPLQLQLWTESCMAPWNSHALHSSRAVTPGCPTLPRKPGQEVGEKESNEFFPGKLQSIS